MDGSISLVLRSTEDCKPVEEPAPPSPSPSASPSRRPAPCRCSLPDLHDHGHHAPPLIDDFGVLPPQVVQVIQPTPYPQFAP